MTAILSAKKIDAIERVAKMVENCLVLGLEAETWHGLTIVLSARTTLEERAALAWSVLRALPPSAVIEAANTVLPDQTSPPIPPLINYMDEAAFWADIAEPDALDAYCLASFKAMHKARQTAFLDFVQGRRAV